MFGLNQISLEIRFARLAFKLVLSMTGRSRG
ncbi:hypothetical protein ABIC35_002480 [Sphingomonas trueperi]